jgi:O-methyltransferase involved in polyketide biosynthesis
MGLYMKKEKSSETAMQMALSRAIESLKTEEERICYDPLAIDFLTLKYKILIQNKGIIYLTPFEFF